MIDFGTVRPGTLLYVPFHTFDSNDPSASVTNTGLAVTDIEIYKDGSVTQRASDNGYTLLDTDGIDFDGITGIHGFSVSLADNSTAGFYSAGSQYWIVVASITVDAATINFIAATFRIGYEEAIINTTIATLASQTSFTLTAGPAEDDALNGCWCVIHDVASAVQLGTAIISDYTGSTKTVTLAAGTTFTAATTDNVSIMAPMPLQPATAGSTLTVTSGRANADVTHIATAAVSTTTAQLGVNVVQISTDATAADNAEAFFDGTGYAGTGNTIPTVTTVNGFGNNALTAAAINADAFTAAKFAADVTTELQSGLATAAALSTLDGKVDTVDNFLDTEIAALTAATIVRTGTAQAGAGTTITLDAGASATDDIYNNQIIVLASGTGAGQARFISDYVGATKVATVPAWQTNPDNTSVFYVLPFGAIPGATAPTAVEIRTEIDANSTQLAAIVADTNEVQISLAAGGLIESMVDDLQSEVDGIQADTEDIQSRLPAALVSGRIDASVGAMAANVMTAAAAAADLTTELQSGLATSAAVATLQTSVDDLPTNAELTTALGTADDAVLAQVALVKAKTDSLTFTVANVLDANVQRINDVTITGDGQVGTEFGV